MARHSNILLRFALYTVSKRWTPHVHHLYCQSYVPYAALALIARIIRNELLQHVTPNRPLQSLPISIKGCKLRYVDAY